MPSSKKANLVLKKAPKGEANSRQPSTLSEHGTSLLFQHLQILSDWKQMWGQGEEQDPDCYLEGLDIPVTPVEAQTLGALTMASSEERVQWIQTAATPDVVKAMMAAWVWSDEACVKALNDTGMAWERLSKPVLLRSLVEDSKMGLSTTEPASMEALLLGGVSPLAEIAKKDLTDTEQEMLLVNETTVPWVVAACALAGKETLDVLFELAPPETWPQDVRDRALLALVAPVGRQHRPGFHITPGPYTDAHRQSERWTFWNALVNAGANPCRTWDVVQPLDYRLLEHMKNPQERAWWLRHFSSNGGKDTQVSPLHYVIHDCIRSYDKHHIPGEFYAATDAILQALKKETSWNTMGGMTLVDFLRLNVPATRNALELGNLLHAKLSGFVISPTPTFTTTEVTLAQTRDHLGILTLMQQKEKPEPVRANILIASVHGYLCRHHAYPQRYDEQKITALMDVMKMLNPLTELVRTEELSIWEPWKQRTEERLQHILDAKTEGQKAHMENVWQAVVLDNVENVMVELEKTAGPKRRL